MFVCICVGVCVFVGLRAVGFFVRLCVFAHACDCVFVRR